MEQSSQDQVPTSEIELVELSPVNLTQKDQEMSTSQPDPNSPGYFSLDWRSSELPSQVIYFCQKHNLDQNNLTHIAF